MPLIFYFPALEVHLAITKQGTQDGLISALWPHGYAVVVSLRIRLRYNARFPLDFLDQLYRTPLGKLILGGGLQGLVNSEMTRHGRSDD